MSNRVPDIDRPEDIPYCFWHPDVPSEQTLQQLLERHLDNTLLRYQVGRACAAGGYADLFHTLGLLPEVAIAEEARDNTHSGKAIYEAIMNAPSLWTYMDDYNCCLRKKPIPRAFLNGDTCVRSTLDKGLPLTACTPAGGPTPSFDITEDWCLSIEAQVPSLRPVDPEAVRLLHSPLPTDLTTVDKDLLILIAAWSGNIDRYARLRRPRFIEGELPCIIRGIYHHPLFARWWLTQATEERITPLIRQAVYARCIMNNDLSWLHDSTPESHLPEMIWHPQPAHPKTYLELARRRPSMASLAARGCMHAAYEDISDQTQPTPRSGMHAYYQEAFDQINWQPDKLLWADSHLVYNRYYQEAIKRKAQEMGIDCEEQFRHELRETTHWNRTWPMAMLAQEWPSRVHDSTQALTLWREITTQHLGFVHPEEATIFSRVGEVLLHACVANELIRPAPPYKALDLGQVYQEMPTDELEEDRRRRIYEE
jgi:hypothetical protein